MADGLQCLKCGTALKVEDKSFSISCSKCGEWHLVDHSGDVPTVRLFSEPAPSAPPPPPTRPAPPPKPSVPAHAPLIDEPTEIVDAAAVARLSLSEPQTVPVVEASAPASTPLPPSPPPPQELTSKSKQLIEELDQAWELRQRVHMVMGATGSPVLPDMASSIAIGVIGVSLGAMLIAAATDAFGRIVGVATLLGGLGLAGYRVKKTLDYQAELTKYQRVRSVSMATKKEGE